MILASAINITEHPRSCPSRRGRWSGPILLGSPLCDPETALAAAFEYIKIELAAQNTRLRRSLAPQSTKLMICFAG
jgi:hypothetical protein